MTLTYLAEPTDALLLLTVTERDLETIPARSRPTDAIDSISV
jgi:hypothetical protein